MRFKLSHNFACDYLQTKLSVKIVADVNSLCVCVFSFQKLFFEQRHPTNQPVTIAQVLTTCTSVSNTNTQNLIEKSYQSSFQGSVQCRSI